MGKTLQFPLNRKQEKPEKIIKACDNGEPARVLIEDETRVLAESLKTGAWYLLQKTREGHYTDVGKAQRVRAPVEAEQRTGSALQPQRNVV